MFNLANEQGVAGARDEGLARYLTEEFVEDYCQERLSRRETLKRLAAVMGSLVAAESLLAACAPPATPAPTPTEPAAPPTRPPAATAAPTEAAATATPAASGVTVPPDDPAIVAGPVEYSGQGATIMAYLARPKGDGPFPGVLICHENRGLTDHFKELPRRFGKAGYVALAVDLLSRQGGFDKIPDPAQIPSLLSSIPAEQLVQDFRDGLAYLQTQPFVAGDRIGMTGFCFGGGVTWRCATQIAELKAAVPFYGPNPPLEDVPKTQAAVLAIYGEADTRITSGAAAIEEAMKKNNKTFEKITYPNAQHAFFNDTGTRYDPAAASDAWVRMLAWFQKYLV
jgi:carboxymethylenebutenolidase